MTGYFEWDGKSHLEDTEIWDWINSKAIASTQVIEAFCDCFHFVGCCNLVVNGQKVRAGDRIYNTDGILTLVRGDTEPLICPTHGIEHSGTGQDLCITTGEHV